MMKEAVARFAREEIAPKVREMDDSMTMDSDVIQGLFDQGFMGVEIPAEHGGTEASFMSAILLIEELAKVDPSVSVMVDVQNTLVNNVFSFYANDEVKAWAFPKLAQNTLGCFCLSEPNAGSDAFALTTRAEDKGDHWLINGNKMWITNSGEAGLFLIFANVDQSKGYKGITCFVAERDTPGLEVGKKEDKLGIRASSTCPVSFTDVKIPKNRVVGEIGKGYKIAIEILNEGRVGIGAQMLGLAQGCYDATLPYLFDRKAFGQTFVKEAAMAKLYASQVAEKTASLCVEWMGGVGFTKDLGIEKFYRDCKIGAIYEGTSNIQKQTIAKIVSTEYKN